MKIALAQINATVGDIPGNAQRIAACIDQARSQSVDLVICPELAIIGYPPRDLLLKPAVIEACVNAVEKLATRCTDIAAIIGYPCPSDHDRIGRPLFNAAAFCHQGSIRHRCVKSLLPTYDVFDEHRYFEPARVHSDIPDTHGRPPHADVFTYQGVSLGVTICEDLWNEPGIFERILYGSNPVEHLVAQGANVLINCSASPFVTGKHDFRRRLFAHTAKKHCMPLLYCNQVGGNDELVFDGNSCVFDRDGTLIAQAHDFEEDLLIVSLPDYGHAAPDRAMSCGGVDWTAEPPTAGGRVCEHRTGTAAVYHALVLGIRDYCCKCGFQSIVLGLSGGIDSAVTAALCVGAIGPDKVRGVTMPSRFSSDGSVNDARDLAANMDLRFDIVPIDPAHGAFEQMLAPIFEGMAPDVTEENIQARTRGVVLMAMSNKFGSLLVTTGNKSEMAVGYCTLYGDMAGGLAALSDVPKTLVWDLARWINDDPASPLRQRFGKAVIPQDSITKPPSAELRPDQKDEDSLPPYPVLDQIIHRYVEEEQSSRRIIAETGIDADTVFRIVRLIDRNEYKRKQAAPGIKVTGRAFGVGRRMPLAQRWDDSQTFETP